MLVDGIDVSLDHVSALSASNQQVIIPLSAQPSYDCVQTWRAGITQYTRHRASNAASAKQLPSQFDRLRLGPQESETMTLGIRIDLCGSKTCLSIGSRKEALTQG
jgi:hypothetical protein